MKKIETIEEWLETGPSKETRKKIMKFIQRIVQGENRRELEDSLRKLKKIELGINAMRLAELPAPAELLQLEHTLRRRVAELKAVTYTRRQI